VRVRTGALEPLLEGSPAGELPLVRVRTAVCVDPLVGAATALAPLARVRGADGAAATLVERAAPLPAPARGRGGRSWRTMCTVRLMTWVRTSATGGRASEAELVLEVEGRSANAASTPAANVVATAAILALVGRLAICGSLGVDTNTVPRARPGASQRRVKLWQKVARASQSSWPPLRPPASPAPWPPASTAPWLLRSRASWPARWSPCPSSEELRVCIVRFGTDVTVGETVVLGGAVEEASAGVEPTGGAEPVVDGELFGGEVFAVEVERVAVAPCRRLGATRGLAGVLARGGASRLPAASGSEDRPMCWPVSWVVAHVMLAGSAIPSSAASAHRAA
jgi:hypothetical protein